MSMIFKGKTIVFTLFLLTAVLGALFIYFGPKAIETNPGVLHLGIRYSDEFSVDFTRFPKGGPGAVLEIFDAQEQLIARYENLTMGRNLIPISTEKFKNQRYTLKISAPTYESITIKANNNERVLRPINSQQKLDNLIFEPNLIGIRLRALNAL